MQGTGLKFEAPNGLKFLIAVQDGCGVWQCLECMQEGFTDNDAADHAEQEVQKAAVEHSYMCPAQRGR
jgi:hypothetical protein